jgi:hypothetical protein
MSDATDQIRNLIHSYAQAIDSGDFERVGRLFEHADLSHALSDQLPVTHRRGASVAEDLKSRLILYGDGTPRTRHLVSDTIIEVDERGGTATARSYNTTLQQVPGHPIEIIAVAAYQDRFERIDGRWRFASRVIRGSSIDGVNRDFIGDMGCHIHRTGREN